MSYRAYLVARKTRKVLELGKLLHDESDRGIGFDRATEEKLGSAALKFLAEHVKHDTVLMPESEFWDLDLTGYERVDSDYGLYFEGPRWFYRPDQT